MRAARWVVCVAVVVLGLSACGDPGPRWELKLGTWDNDCQPSTLETTTPVTQGAEELVAWGVGEPQVDGSLDGYVVELEDLRARVSGDAAELRPVDVLMHALEDEGLGRLHTRGQVSVRSMSEDVAQVGMPDTRYFGSWRARPVTVGFTILCDDYRVSGELHAMEVVGASLIPCTLLDENDTSREDELARRACEGDLEPLLTARGAVGGPG